MRYVILAAVLSLSVTQSAAANDWEKFFTPLKSTTSLPSTAEPEIIPSTGDFDQDIGGMWRRGFAPIGYTSFSTGNDKTKDAQRFAKKLQARYVIVRTNLASSSTASMPITTPTTQTSYTNGTANAYGSGGYASGTYSGTTTTYGSQTSYIPIQINRFNKLAVYFQEVPKTGLGIYYRELTAHEIASLESRRAIPVQFVRDGSPAYLADILPGDIVTHLNGQPADSQAVDTAVRGPQPIRVRLIRNGTPRELAITVPADWVPKP